MKDSDTHTHARARARVYIISGERMLVPCTIHGFIHTCRKHYTAGFYTRVINILLQDPLHTSIINTKLPGSTDVCLRLCITGLTHVFRKQYIQV